MNKNKPTKLKHKEYKKSVVRNTDCTKPKIAVIEQSHGALQNGDPEPSAVAESCTKPSAEGKGGLDSPELNSALRIIKKIEKVENTRLNINSFPDLDKKKSAVNERVMKQLNFPHDRPIYKDLLPLCVRTRQFQLLPSISRETVKKDTEPQLSDFYTPKRLQEYNFEVPVSINQNVPCKQFDGLKLYRIANNWH